MWCLRKKMKKQKQIIKKRIFSNVPMQEVRNDICIIFHFKAKRQQYERRKTNEK